MKKRALQLSIGYNSPLPCKGMFFTGSMTRYVLLSCMGCDAVYFGGGGDPGSVDVFVQHLQC